MKILFATGIYPPQVGGPSYYAYALNREFEKKGIETVIATYGSLLRFPLVIRQFLYLVKLLVLSKKCDGIIGFDAVSVGLPAVLAGKILNKKVVLRLGGDFLWEQYIERKREKITLSQFYKHKRAYTRKEKIIFFVINYVVKKTDMLVFSTPWFRDIFKDAYDLNINKTMVIENALELSGAESTFVQKKYIWAGRNLFLKNKETLKKAFILAKKNNPDIFLEIFENLPHEELMEKVKTCYAVVYPSLSEVSPNFPLEALSFGKPSIITKETGYVSLLQDVALFVDPLSEEDIAKKILFLAEEKNYQALVLKARTFTHSHTYTEVADEYLKLFRILL